MKRDKKRHIFKQERTRIFNDQRTDVYREKKKYKDPTRCPHCHALFSEGRWTWNESLLDTFEALCPACRRIEDNYPAGFVEISGPFSKEHHPEIMHLIKNVEQAESEEHPLERIMEIHTDDEITTLSTTGIHLPRRIGAALKNAYKGNLEISYESENYIRVHWIR